MTPLLCQVPVSKPVESHKSLLAAADQPHQKFTPEHFHSRRGKTSPAGLKGETQKAAATRVETKPC